MGESKFRSDPTLIAHVEAFGIDHAAGKYAKLSIATVPKFYTFYIDEYDGREALSVNFPGGAPGPRTAKQRRKRSDSKSGAEIILIHIGTY